MSDAINEDVAFKKKLYRKKLFFIGKKCYTIHGKKIVSVEKQYTVAQQIFDEKLSVRETEKLVKKIQQEKNQKDTEKNKKIDPKLEAICHDLEEKMKGILGTKVAINQKDSKKGKIEIEYYSMDELDRIMDLFRTIEK